jgi:phi13 family phage major tail protein
MAYYGLRYPYVGKYDAANDTYTAPTLSARAIAFTVTPNYAEGSLAADDDANSEYDKEFTDADVTLGTDTIPDAWRADMFGNEVDSESGEIASNKDDNANYVGVGVIAPEKIRGVKSWVAVFLPLVKFTEPGDDFETKGSSITYKTPSIAGKAKCDESGNWRYRERFTDVQDAKDYILSKFGVTSSSGSGSSSGNGNG